MWQRLHGGQDTRLGDLYLVTFLPLKSPELVNAVLPHWGQGGGQYMSCGRRFLFQPQRSGKGPVRLLADGNGRDQSLDSWQSSLLGEGESPWDEGGVSCHMGRWMR